MYHSDHRSAEKVHRQYLEVLLPSSETSGEFFGRVPTVAGVSPLQYRRIGKTRTRSLLKYFIFD